MFGYGKDKSGSGSQRDWERRGLFGSQWDRRDISKEAKAEEKAGWGDKEGTVIRRWARIRLEANLDEKCTDWDV